MNPVVHQRMYAEIESSRLLRYTLRILVDPACVAREDRLLLDIDTLRRYLKDLESPCRIVFMLPAHSAGRFDDDYNFMRQIGVEILPIATLVVPEVTVAFPDTAVAPLPVVTLASTALIGDADILLSDDLATQPEIVRRFRDLKIDVLTGVHAKHSCEVFVRGHEIPWTFNRPVWWMPWLTFYCLWAEPEIQELEQLRGMASQKGFAPDVQEHIRSLGLNRWSAIAYTRDKLLFYVLQRRSARREKLERQDFGFELAYYLNHYCLLFWGGLDQVCWIVNGVCGLGFLPNQWRQVGVSKRDFLARLTARDPEIAVEFQEPEFVRWVDVLKRTRHYVAHLGTAVLSPLYEDKGEEPTEEEIDREIERWPEWRNLTGRYPAEIIEAFRPTFRMRWWEQHHRKISDAAFVIPGATDQAIVFPLENIEWEYERFRQFVLGVARKCKARLAAIQDAPP